MERGQKGERKGEEEVFVVTDWIYGVSLEFRRQKKTICVMASGGGGAWNGGRP